MHWMQHYMYCTVTTAHSAQQSYDASGHTGSEGGEEKLRWRIIDTACPRPDHRSTVDMVRLSTHHTSLPHQPPPSATTTHDHPIPPCPSPYPLGPPPPQRVVLQRVSSASVTVGSRPISSIGRGLLVLVGIARDDGPHEAEWMAKKLLSVRLWEEEGVAWKGSVASLQLDLLLVSQFTLHAELKGNKPDFRLAMPPTQAKVDPSCLYPSLWAPSALPSGDR